jgi:hypothetical protein
MGYRSIIMNFLNIKEETITHFEELYTESIGVDPTVKTKMLEDIPSLISSYENAKLIKETHEEEIQNTIWGLDPNKAPRPDRFTIHFYRACSNIIKKDLKRMM